MYPLRMLIGLTICSAACSSSPSAPSVSQPLPLLRLQSDASSLTYYSGLRQSQRILVRDQTAWQEVWTTIWQLHVPAPPLPAIDFSRDMVVVAALGERLTGGFSILVDSASETASSVTISIRTVSPAAGCGVTLALTQPVDAARLPLRTGPVTFEERSVVLPCQ